MSRPSAAPGEGSTPDVLTIQIQGGDGEPERVLLVARPVGDRVRVREWNSAGTADTSSERDCSIDEVMALIARATRERRRVSEDALTIRRWLGVPLG